VQYREESEVKSESGQDSEADAQSVAPEKTEPVEQKGRIENLIPESAEDQLLQESIQSAATAATSSENTSTSVENAKPVVDLPAKDASQPEPAAKQAPLPPSESAQPPGTTSEPNVAQMEIPDSQEEVRDSMDVDGPDGSTDPVGPQPQKTFSPKEQALPTPTVPSTPLLETPAQKVISQAPERAVTRVSSGAMRLKSVNEIVGSTPRTSNDRSVTKVAQNQLTPVTSTPQSPASRHRHGSHKRDRSKGQVSTVVFGKQPRKVEEKAVVASQKDTFQPSDDYFTPLFLQGFTASSNVMQPIEKILFHANKTVATPDTNLAIQDHQACKVLRRVYQLQQYEKWSLRQIKRCPEPTRPASQWDVVLQEMKWMRTDFREERKWKAAVAKNLAHACAHWHEASPEERKALQVPAFIPPKAEPANDVSMTDADEEGIDFQPTPDLISSGDVDSPQLVDELAEEFPETVPPSAIFTLQEDDVIFGLRRTQASDRLLDELPIYGSPLKIPRFDLTGPEYDPDAHWRRPALPLSKYVEGQMKVMSDGPPRKRSRYNYQNEDSEDEEDGGFVGYGETETAKLPPSSEGVALFNPESKPIRDRLHAGHQFRPPSEHPMPTQSFYECRSPSQWVMAEDDELRGLVRDYSYNWSLISSMLTTKSLFVSGAERRTPWECFERWINLEGLPADMQKTQYFKAYNSRIEAAQRVIAQQNQLAAQQANASGGAITPVRRRQSTPLRVERRRNQKHLTLIDAMRKLAKKRETTIQKQQHTASQSVANKKTNDAMSQRPTKTPRDYSLLRWERDQALAEKMAQYAQRQEAQRRVSTIYVPWLSAQRILTFILRLQCKPELKVKPRRWLVLQVYHKLLRHPITPLLTMLSMVSTVPIFPTSWPPPLLLLPLQTKPVLACRCRRQSMV
jgi:chromatin modification-related protein VID21